MRCRTRRRPMPRATIWCANPTTRGFRARSPSDSPSRARPPWMMTSCVASACMMRAGEISTTVASVCKPPPANYSAGNVALNARRQAALVSGDQGGRLPARMERIHRSSRGCRAHRRPHSQRTFPPHRAVRHEHGNIFRRRHAARAGIHRARRRAQPPPVAIAKPQAKRKWSIGPMCCSSAI